MEKKKRTNYMMVELCEETAQIISAACESTANLTVGKLENIEAFALNAYKKRTGTDMPDEYLDQIKMCLKTIQLLGWDSTYSTENKNVHFYSKASDTMFDTSEVLNYQLGVNNEAFKDSTYPMHWNEDLPLPRIIKTTSSVYNRNKQLTIFPTKK